MKRIILATVLGLATVGSASAMVASGELTEGVKAQAEYILPGVSFDNLTASQATRIEGLLTGGKDLTESDFKLRIMQAIAS